MTNLYIEFLLYLTTRQKGISHGKCSGCAMKGKKRKNNNSIYSRVRTAGKQGARARVFNN